jgi:DNA-binding winged helix-turn-helix (wHTH) protein
MSNEAKTLYEFGPFTLNVQDRRLLFENQRLSLPQRQFEILLWLLENSNRVVSREEIVSKVWAGQIVEESNLTVHISHLRRVLGPDYIETIPGIGYRFKANVQVSKESTQYSDNEDDDFSNTIKQISPDFLTIYRQAVAAEQLNLFELCGTGYRKALEVLLKDYATTKFPPEKETIIKKSLLDCVDEYIHNDKVKQVASQAIWLGNWETHYLYRWDSKALDDLKIFIKLIVHALEVELELEKLEQEGFLINSYKRKWWQTK